MFCFKFDIKWIFFFLPISDTLKFLYLKYLAKFNPRKPNPVNKNKLLFICLIFNISSFNEQF